VNCTDNVGCVAVKCHTSDVDIDVMSMSLSQSGSVWSGNTAALNCGTSPIYYCKGEDAADNESAALVVQFTIAPESASGVIEAESGSLVAPVSAVTNPGASGTAIRTTTQFSGTATYSVNIPTAGYYQLTGRFYSVDNGSDSWTFSVDGGADNTWGVGNIYGQWVEKNWGADFLFSSAGSKTVVFTGREMDCLLDWIRFDLRPCQAGQLNYCISESDCSGAGGVWADGLCKSGTVIPPNLGLNRGIYVPAAPGGVVKPGGGMVRPY
jgi:hypothetical protein